MWINNYFISDNDVNSQLYFKTVPNMHTLISAHIQDGGGS